MTPNAIFTGRESRENHCLLNIKIVATEHVSGHLLCSVQRDRWIARGAAQEHLEGHSHRVAVKLGGCQKTTHMD